MTGMETKETIKDLQKALETGYPPLDKLKPVEIVSWETIDNQMRACFVDTIAHDCYLIAKDHGFHPNETIGEVSLERLAKFIANLHGECSELWEAGRKGVLNKPCDKDPSMTNLEEELADIVIRAFDTAYSYGISIGDAIFKKSKYNESRPYMHGKKC